MKIKYNDLVDLDKLKDVYKIIRKNTKNKSKLFKFEMFYTCNIVNIYYILKNRLYKHSEYNIFLIKEPKYRIIMSEIMSDKIVNHLISKYVLSPLIEPKLIEQNVATRKNKGTIKGLFYVKKYLNKIKMNNDKVYVLKCDIKKYFYNIDHEIILNKVYNLVEDEEIYNVIKNIISSTDEEYVNQNIKIMVDNEVKRISKKNVTNKDMLIKELYNIPLYKKGKGLPIGNMTSQILAIYYLNELDHYIKEKLHCKYYVRYMDDFIILDSDKNRLLEIKNILSEKMSDYKLELNSKTNIFDLKHGFNFLGYRFILNNKKLIIKLNSSTRRRIEKKFKYLNKHKVKNYDLIKVSYEGYFKFANVGKKMSCIK